MFAVTVITYFCLSETRGRSPAELDEMFAAGLPARKFNSKCTWWLLYHALLTSSAAYVCSTAPDNFIEGAESEVKHGTISSHIEIAAAKGTDAKV
jgi:hypothetical protein